MFDYEGALGYARSTMKQATIPPVILEVVGDPATMPAYFAQLHDLMAPQTA